MPAGSHPDARPLPSHLRHVFWDTALGDIDTDTHSRFVIERVLEYGDAPAVHWLWQRYGPEPIREVVRVSRRLSAPTRSLWSRHLGLEGGHPWPEGAAPPPTTSGRP